MAEHYDEKGQQTPDNLVGGPAISGAEEKETRVSSGRRSTTSLRSLSPSEPATLADEHGPIDAEAALQRTKTAYPPPVKVPRSQRRGLLARFAVVAEVTEPIHYKNNIKWFITFIVAVAGAAAPVGSAIIFPTLDQISTELHSTPTITNLSVALYMLSMAIFPLWWSAFSETLGRRTIYLTSFAMFVLFTALCAASKTISMLVVMRMLSGGAAASVQAVGAGTIADIWEPKERGRAMGMFYLGPLCGPLFAPVIGGIVGQHWNWRATQWVLAIYGILTWIFVFFALPETLKSRRSMQDAAAEEAISDESATATQNPTRPPLSRTSTKEQVQTTSKKYIRMLRILFIDPLKVILYLRFMPVLLTVYYASVTFGSLYVLNVSVQYTFERQPYEFETIIIGLLYLPNSLGYVLASIFGGRWMDAIMKREAVKANRVSAEGKLIFRPEDRMRENAWLGAILYPSALIWYGWTAQHGVFWVVPMIANFFYGIGSMLIFAMATTMLTEFMPRKSSSGVALNNFMRNIFSCVGGIVGAPIIAAIGNGWLFTILGLWAFSSAAVIWAMKRFGPRWREKLEEEFH